MHGQGREISTQCHPVSVKEETERDRGRERERKREREKGGKQRMRFPFDSFPKTKGIFIDDHKRLWPVVPK
jgi:hypothetical protein